MVTQVQATAINDCIRRGVIALTQDKWCTADACFSGAYSLIIRDVHEQFTKFSLAQLVTALIMIAKFQQNKTTDVWDLYVSRIGVIGTERNYVDSQKFKDLVPTNMSLTGLVHKAQAKVGKCVDLVNYFIYLQQQGMTIYLRDGNQTRQMYSWLTLNVLIENRELVNSLYNKKVLPFLWQKLTTYRAEDQKYLNGCDHRSLGIPSFLEAAVMAHDVYQQSTTLAYSTIDGCSLAEQPAPYDLKKQGWELIRLIGTQVPDYYFAKAFIHRKRKIVVIASRGTRGKSYEDWTRANAFLIQGKMPKTYFEQAEGFYQRVLTQLQECNLHGDHLIYFTGHSLGGAISELLCCKYNIPAITFDSPGVKEIIEWQNDNDAARGRPLTFDQSAIDINKGVVPVVGILTKPNLVNTCNKQIGRTLCIPQYWFNQFDWDLNPLSWNNIKRQVFRSDALPKDLVEAIKSVSETLRSHFLPRSIEFLAKDPPPEEKYGLRVVKFWPTSYAAPAADLELQPLYHRRLMCLGRIPAPVRTLIELASTIRNDATFTNNEIKTLLHNIKFCDRCGADSTFTDGQDRAAFFLTHGKIKADEVRLLMWHCAYHERFQGLRGYLGTKAASSQPDNPLVMEANLASAATDPVEVFCATDWTSIIRSQFVLAIGVGIGITAGCYMLGKNPDSAIRTFARQLCMNDPTGWLGWNTTKSIAYGVIDSYITKYRYHAIDSYKHSSTAKQTGIVLASTALTIILRKILLQSLNSRGDHSWTTPETCFSGICLLLEEAIRKIYTKIPPNQPKIEFDKAVYGGASCLVGAVDTCAPMSNYGHQDKRNIDAIVWPCVKTYNRPTTMVSPKEYDARTDKIFRQISSESADHQLIRGLARFGTTLVIRPIADKGFKLASKNVQSLMQSNVLSPWLAGLSIGALSTGAYLYFTK